MSFALTDLDQYYGKRDVYLKGHIRIVFYSKLGSYLGRKMIYFGRTQLYKLWASLYETKSGQNRNILNNIINLTQPTYLQTLKIGKILRKSEQIGPKWYI